MEEALDMSFDRLLMMMMMRGISRVSSTYKILSNILLSQLTTYAVEIIADHQCGFRRHRLTTDHILCIRKMLEKNENEMKQCNAAAIYRFQECL